MTSDVKMISDGLNRLRRFRYFKCEMFKYVPRVLMCACACLRLWECERILTQRERESEWEREWKREMCDCGCVRLSECEIILKKRERKRESEKERTDRDLNDNSVNESPYQSLQGLFEKMYIHVSCYQTIFITCLNFYPIKVCHICIV